MEQFGLGWDAVHDLNPALTMVRLPRTASTVRGVIAPDLAQTMEAITGMACNRPSRRPSLLPRGACDPLAAMHAVFATFLAVQERDRNGDGRLVEATMIEACAEHGRRAGGRVLRRWPTPRAPRQPGAGRTPGVCIPPPATKSGWHWRSPPTSSGLGCEWRSGTRPGRATLRSQPMPGGERPTTYSMSRSPWCASRDARVTAERFAPIGIPAAQVVDARDIARNPQLNHRGFFEVEDHPVTGLAPAADSPVPVPRPPAVGCGPAPTLGSAQRRDPRRDPRPQRR